VVVEKILVRDERLRPDWAVHGTTGYEFLNLVNGLFVDPQPSAISTSCMRA
jgi:(1->4)-alpha-D-glucan 1-alpha-D-glucosylmutase